MREGSDTYHLKEIENTDINNNGPKEEKTPIFSFGECKKPKLTDEEIRHWAVIRMTSKINKDYKSILG